MILLWLLALAALIEIVLFARGGNLFMTFGAICVATLCLTRIIYRKPHG